MLRVSQEQTTKHTEDCAVAEGSAGVWGEAMEVERAGTVMPLPGSFSLGEDIRQRDSGLGNGFILFFKCRELKRMS